MKKLWLMLTLLTLCGIATAQPDNKYCGVGNVPSFGTSDGVASLPRSCYYTARSATPSPNGVQWTPTTSSALSAALSGASCGDIIQIPAGTTISGNFSYNKVCDSTHYVTLQTSGSLPPEGTRITPCYAGIASEAGYPSFGCTSTTKQVATINTPNSSWALNIGGASYLRIIGIEFSRSPNTGVNFFLVGTNGTPTDHIIFDQVVVHGVQNGPSSCQSTGRNCDESTRGVGFTAGTYFAFVDGFYWDFWCLAGTGACTDTQAVNANPSNFPSSTIKVVNNFMTAAGETIIFGGAGTGTTQQSDFEIRRNWFFKPLTWDPHCTGSPLPSDCQGQTYDGYSRSTKNLFELKDGDHGLVEANMMQNVWPGYSQFGEAWALTPRQYGGSSNGVTNCCSDHDLTFRYNYMSHICQVWESGTDSSSQGTYNLNIHDNIADDMSFDASGGSYACNISGLYTMTFGSPPHTIGLTGVTINNGGTGCSGGATWTDPPTSGSLYPRVPVAAPTISGGVVTGFTITDPGADLTSALAVSVSCSGTQFSGTPVTGTTQVNSTVVQNTVTVNHNTIVTPLNTGTDGMFILDGPIAGEPAQVNNIVFTNNIADGGAFGVHQSIGGTYSCTIGKPITGISVAGGGTGYTLNDILTVVLGSGWGATVKVTGVSSGVITSVSLLNGGGNFSTGTATVTGGTGSGATLTISSVGPGNAANNGTLINGCWNPKTWDCNYVARGTSGGGNYPSGAHCGATATPSDFTSIQFTSYNNGISNGSLDNYRLLSSSAYHNAGTDGKDLGADITAVENALAGTNGGNSVSLPMNLTVNPASVVGTVFISPTGSDSNPCTALSPCQTPQKATTVLRTKPAGQRIAVFRGCPSPLTPCAAGTYVLSSAWNMSDSLGDSGTAADGVLYTNYPGEYPIISFGKQVTGWAVCTSLTCPNLPTLTCGGSCTMYYVNLTAANWQNFEQLYYNGQRRYRPMTTALTSVNGINPNYKIQKSPVCKSTSSTNCPQQGTCGTGQFQCYDRFTRDSTDTSTSFHGLAYNDLEIYLFDKWSADLMRGAVSNTDTNACTTTSTIMCFNGRTAGANNNFGPLNNHRYLIVNDRASFNTAKQFLLDRDPTNSGSIGSTYTLYYAAAAGENPTTDTVIAPQLTKMMTLTSLQYVKFQGLSFQYGSWVTPATGLASLSHASNIGAQITCNNCQHVDWIYNSFAHNGAWTLEYVGANGSGGASTQNTVAYNAFYDMGVGGIRIGHVPAQTDTDTNVAQYVVVYQNVIEGGQRDLPGGTGTAVAVANGHHNTIMQNTMYDWYNGIIEMGASQGYVGGTCNVTPFTSCSLTHDNVIQYNWLYNSGQGVTDDMGAVHFANGSQPNNVFDYNFVSDFTQDLTTTGYNGQGIYVDQSSSFVTVSRNIVTRTSQCSIDINSPDNLQNGVIVTNNIFALGRQCAMIKSGSGSALVFTGTKNIIYYDKGNSTNGWQWDTGGPQWISTAFSMDTNLYYDPAVDLSSNNQGFLTTDSSGNVTRYGFANWQTIVGQDRNSVIANPLFTNPTYPADDFSFTSTSAYSQIGFAPIVRSLIGADTTKVPPYQATVPFAFPLQLLDPLTAY